MPRHVYYIYTMRQSRSRKQDGISLKKSLKKPAHTKSKKQSKRQSKTSKKISLKETLVKVVEAVKKPFANIDNAQSIDGGSSSQNTVDVPFAESSTRTSNSKFFYTNDIDIQTFDDWQLYQHVSARCPGMSMDESSELAKRNAIVEMLNDTQFMAQTLEDYNMTILDFVKFLYRLSPSVFKGLFVRKIQKTLKDKPYAQSLKFGSYSRRKKQSAKRSSAVF